MKQIEVKIIVQVDDDFDIETITLRSDDVVDGFLLSRDIVDDDDDVTSNFKMHNANITNIMILSH